MEARLGSIGSVLLALAAAACSTVTSSRPHDGGRVSDAGSHAETGTPGHTPADAAPPLRFFTGTVQGTDARVAVVAAQHHARIYFCGGDATYTSLSRWVPAAIEGDGTLVPDAKAEMGWDVNATLSGDNVSGTLATGDAARLAFDAKSVDAHTIAGLYEGSSPCGKVGLIVSQPTPDDDAIAQGACISATTMGTVDIHQVNPVAPFERAADGTIAVEVAGTMEQVTLTPALVAD